MNRATIDVAGAVTFWSLRPCNRAALQTALESCNAADYMPPAITPNAALLLGMQGIVGRSKTKAIHPLKGGGYECVEVIPGTNRNEYPQLFRAEMRECGPVLEGDCDETALFSAVFYALQTVQSMDIGKLFTRVVKDLHAISLRDTGGFYWLAENAMERWSEIANAVCTASGAVVTMARWEANPSSIALLVSELNELVNAECEKLMGELTDGQEHNSKFYESRKDTASALRAKIQAVREQLDITKVESEETLAATEAALTACLLAQ